MQPTGTTFCAKFYSLWYHLGMVFDANGDLYFFRKHSIIARKITFGIIGNPCFAATHTIEHLNSNTTYMKLKTRCRCLMLFPAFVFLRKTSVILRIPIWLKNRRKYWNPFALGSGTDGGFTQKATVKKPIEVVALIGIRILGLLFIHSLRYSARGGDSPWQPRRTDARMCEMTVRHLRGLLNDLASKVGYRIWHERSEGKSKALRLSSEPD